MKPGEIKVETIQPLQEQSVIIKADSKNKIGKYFWWRFNSDVY